MIQAAPPLSAHSLASVVPAEGAHRDRFFAKNVLTVSQFNHEDLHVLFNLAHEMRLMYVFSILSVFF